MRVEYLRYFLCASEEESLSKAAERLHFSQQGLSRVIKSLESEYGVRLFSRSNTKSSLTPAGVELQRLARTVVDDYERLERGMHDYANRSSQSAAQLTLCMTLNVIHHAYPLFADAVRAAFPRWRIRIEEIDQKDLLDRVNTRGAENTLFFVSIPSPRIEEYAKDGRLFFKPLIDTELDVAVARTSSLSSKKSLTWDELENIRFALLKDEGMIELLRQKHCKNLLSKSDLWISDNKILESLMENDDIATFSTSFLAKCSNSSRFVHIPLENTISTPIGFFSHEERLITQEATELVNFIELFFTNQHHNVLFPKGTVIAQRWTPRFTQSGAGDN